MKGGYSPLYRGHSVIKKVAQNAQAWRLLSGFSQKDLAKITDLSVCNISAFENGRNNNAFILYTYITLGFNPDIDYIKIYYE